jgi:hypothetical protein
MAHQIVLGLGGDAQEIGPGGHGGARGEQRRGE